MKIWLELQQNLQKGFNVILLVVVDHQGSSPGKKGFKMLVCEDGTLSGSIGGGLTERNMVEEAKTLFHTPSPSPYLKTQVHRNKVKNSSGMVCAGSQIIGFYPLTFSQLNLIKNICKSERGIVIYNQKGIDFKEETINTPHSFYQKHKDWQYFERLTPAPKLYIIGGGHVGLATAQVFQYLNFDVEMIDNRKNLNTFESNEYSSKLYLEDYNRIGDVISDRPDKYIIIVTQSYDFDKLVLSKLIIKSFAFIGVLGSKSKINKLFKALLTEGFSQEQISKINAPIGIGINCNTPAEIAISIAAKIIEVSNN